MAGSVQLALRSAFVDALTTAVTAAEPDFDGEIAFAWSSALERNRERIWTYGAPAPMEPASMRAGATFFRESGSFWVHVEVLLPGKGVEDVLARCYELAAIVTSQAALHRTDLAVDGLQWITCGGIDEHVEGRTEKGSGARVRLVINYEARVETP